MKAMITIDDVMKEHPTLTASGFMLVSGAGARRSPEEFERGREELRNAGVEVEAARGWIRANLRPRKTVNRRAPGFHGSYGLKHIIEEGVNRYIANGVCIVAMVLEGYHVYRRDGDGPNCCFNVSSKPRKA